jgi:hypothetical protein
MLQQLILIYFGEKQPAVASVPEWLETDPAGC